MAGCTLFAGAIGIFWIGMGGRPGSEDNDPDQHADPCAKQRAHGSMHDLIPPARSAMSGFVQGHQVGAVVTIFQHSLSGWAGNGTNKNQGTTAACTGSGMLENCFWRYEFQFRLKDGE